MLRTGQKIYIYIHFLAGNINHEDMWQISKTSKDELSSNLISVKKLVLVEERTFLETKVFLDQEKEKYWVIMGDYGC